MIVELEAFNNKDENKKFRDDFYFLCQDNGKEKDISAIFKKEDVKQYLTLETVEIGLMGCARKNQIGNAIAIFNNLDNSCLEQLNTSAMVNMALLKNHYNFLDRLYVLNEWNSLFKDQDPNKNKFPLIEKKSMV